MREELGWKIEAERSKESLELRREAKKGKKNGLGEEMFRRDRRQGKEGEWIIEMGKGEKRMYRGGGMRVGEIRSIERNETWKMIEREKKRRQKEERWKKIEESRYNRWCKEVTKKGGG